MNEHVLSFQAALAEVLAHASAIAAPRTAQSLPLLEAAGRVLARPLDANRDQPPFDRATRDGFAVRSSDLTAAAADKPGRRILRVIGSVRAGEVWRGQTLTAGDAIEIMTGAPMPEGADAVVMVEHTHLTGDTLRIDNDRTLHPGENVVPRAAEARAGDRLLPSGRVLHAAEIAVAASCGCAQIEVFAQPDVAIVATGDELVELDRQPEPWQIRNSNSYALAALVQGEGGNPRRLPIAGDTLADLRERIAQALDADLILLSGGVSMGKYDLVEQVLQEAAAEFFFTGALIQPGKPIVFGRLPSHVRKSGPIRLRSGQDGAPDSGSWTYFFGLPGNPVSTQVCFHLFVAPMLRALAGRTELAPTFVEARLEEDVKGGARVTRFLPAELTSAWDHVTVRVVGWQGSGDIAANARGNCYAVLPAGVEAFPAGETVRVLLR